MTAESPIRVLVVDDSAVIRGLLKRSLEKEPDIHVVATAEDARSARDAIVTHEPDVVTLDVEMPGMNGIELLRRVMAQHPMPVVIVSSMVSADSPIAKQAKDAGAYAVVAKPADANPESVTKLIADLKRLIRRAAGTRAPAAGAASAGGVQGTAANDAGAAPVAASAPARAPAPSGEPAPLPVIVIGASTGGPEALRQLLSGLPAAMPPIVIAQHMPAKFTKSLAARLNDDCALTVREAVSGEPLRPGTVLLAPGHMHMKLRRAHGELVVLCVAEIEGHLYRPSVDVLMTSAAELLGADAIGVMLTGMGEDGAKGLLQMRHAGAHTVAQDEQSSAVYGMPRAAALAGATERVKPLDEIGELLQRWVRDHGRRAA